MAVTVLIKPLDLVPGYNNIEYVAFSNQAAQPNFKFYVTVTVGADTSIFRIDANVSGGMYINIQDVVTTYLKNTYNYSGLEWLGVTDGYKDVTVNIGEEYGTTPVIYTGTDHDIGVWNGSLTYKERATYRPADVYPFIWLNNYDANAGFTDVTKTYRAQDLPFYFLDPDLQIEKVVIKTLDYQPSGITILQTYEIVNPKTLKYISINLSPDVINEVAGTAVFDGTENFYTLEFWNATDPISVCNVMIQEVCTARATAPQWLFYLNRYGAFDPVDMKLITREQSDVERIFYNGLVRGGGSYVDYLAGDKDGPNPQLISKRVLSTSYTDKSTLSSEWLTTKQQEDVKDLFTTPETFIQHAYQDYTIVSPDIIQFNKKYELVDKNIQIVVPVDHGVSERRQRQNG